jgi:hypothetical protein
VSLRTIHRHLGGAVPRLVTAAVRAASSLQISRTPPQLKTSRKIRSSRRYFPSSPFTPADSNADDGLDIDYGMDAGIGDDVDARGSAEHDLEENHEIDVELAVNQAHEGVWSGQPHETGEDETEEEELDEEEWEELEHDRAHPIEEWGDEAYDDWRDPEEDREESSYGLSALNELDEAFEREAVANGKYFASV